MEHSINTTKIVQINSKTNISYNTYGAWRFHPNGILSENIFGPVFDYTCACGIIRPKDYVCPICGVKSESSLYRFIKTTKIKYPFYFIKGYLYMIFNNTKKVFHSNYGYYYNPETDNIEHKKIAILNSDILLYDHLIIATIKRLTNQEYFIEDEIVNHYNKYIDKYERIATEIINGIEQKTGVLYTIIKDLFYNVKYKNIVTNKITLLPAGFRYMHFNTTTSDNTLSIYTNEYNRRYIKLVYIQNQLKELDLDTAMAQYMYNLVKFNNTILTENTLHYLTKKKGLYRQYLLGRRVDLSYRTVLVGDPSLYVNEIAIPYHGFIHIAYLDLLKIMPYNMKKNIDILEHAIKSVIINDELKSYIHKLMEEKEFYVLLMRQPVLHLPSTQQFKIVKLHDEYVIKTNQIVWSGYNADSDGDTVVIFRINKDDNFDTNKHILLPNSKLNFAIEYDSLAGLVY